jgi:hypothetical protein
MSKRYDIKTEIKNLPYNIKNIIGWVPILWNNFDWAGDHFLLEIIEHKLKTMKNYFENDTIICDEEAKQIVEQISSCIDACGHLITTDFESELLDKHYDKYPKSLEKFFESPNIPMSDEERKDFDQMTKSIDEKTQLYQHQLFDTMRDKCSWWWD